MADTHFSHRLEFRAIRGITGNNRDLGARMFASVVEEDFVKDGPGRAFYTRIRMLVEKNGAIPRWDQLIEDSAIAERNREDYEERERDDDWMLEDIDHVLSVSEQLTDYRRQRQMAELSVDIQKGLQQEQIDINKIMDTVSDALVSARTAANSESQFVHMGVKSNFKQTMLSMLEGQETRFIETGIAAYDRKSMGWPRGSLVGLGSDSGGGKSTMARQISLYQAGVGRRTAMGTLEMTHEESMQRDISDIADVNMNDLLDPRNRLTSDQRRRLMDDVYDRDDKIYKAGGLRTTFVPKTDVGMEEMLFLLKPYNYDVIFVDYVGLLKGMTSDDKQWLKLGNATRIAKQFAVSNNMVVCIVMQVSAEGLVRYSQAMKDHCNILWTWANDDRAKETGVVEVRQQKSRNSEGFTFYLRKDFEHNRFLELDEKSAQTMRDNRKKSNSSETPYKPAQDDGQPAKRSFVM